MRVIAGKMRGLKLMAPKDGNVRPTTDRVKEALFGRIQFDIPNANVLDLFSGTGALGLEAASRSAKSVVLCDNDPGSVNLIGKNVKRAGNPPEIQIVKKDYAEAIKLFQNTEKFDIVLIDPPYDSGYYDAVLSYLVVNRVLKDNAILVLESDHSLNLDDTLVSVEKERKIGSVFLTYCRYNMR